MNKYKKQPDIDLTESAQDGKRSGSELIRRQAAIDAINDHFGFNIEEEYGSAVQEVINGLPSAEPEYEPVTAKDFAKTMSENTLYGFMAWYGEALELMKRQGFVICKKTM